MFLFEICSRNAAPSFCEAWPASGPAAEFSQRGSFYSAAVKRLILFKLRTPLLRARQEDEFVYWMGDQFVYYIWQGDQFVYYIYIWMSEGRTLPSQASATQEPWRGLPKVKSPARQWFSKVEIASKDVFE